EFPLSLPARRVPIGSGALCLPEPEYPVAFEAFTPSWAEAWAEELNTSLGYRAAAEKWEGAVALVLDHPDPEAQRAVILDLWHGSCRSAGVGGPGGGRAAKADGIRRGRTTGV